MQSYIQHCNKKCPKCKSGRLILQEIWKGHYISWELIDGKFDANDGSLEPGDAYKVIGECRDCSHIWVFRKVLQIHDICE